MKRTVIILAAALLAAAPILAAEWGAIHRRGDVEIYIAPIDPKPTLAIFGVDAADTPGILLSVMTRNAETTAFKVTLRFERDGKRLLRSVVLERGVNMPLSAWSWYVFYVGRVKVLSVHVEELKTGNTADVEGLGLEFPSSP